MTPFTCAKVAVVAGTPGCSQAPNLEHSKECLTAQCNFVAYDTIVNLWFSLTLQLNIPLWPRLSIVQEQQSVNYIQQIEFLVHPAMN